jgi:hypothetical protein
MGTICPVRTLFFKMTARDETEIKQNGRQFIGFLISDW